MYKKWIRITGETLTIKPCFKFRNNNWLLASCKCIAKHLKPGKNNLHASVRQWAPPYDLFFPFFSVSCLPQNWMLECLRFLPLPDPCQRWSESLFQTSTPLLFHNFWNPGPAILQIWESDSCSDSSQNHRSNRSLPTFLPKKWPRRLLLLPKWKSDSGSGSGFSQIFDSGSGSERKTQKEKRRISF